MTTAHAPRRQALSEDAAISAAVYALLDRSGESVSDLAYHTRISVASIYRKLGGQASWKVADVGAVARHYRLQPGDLFLGPQVLERPASRPDGPEGPDGGEVCAIRDSNPEPADSGRRGQFEFANNVVTLVPASAPPHPRVAAEPAAAYRRAA